MIGVVVSVMQLGGYTNSSVVFCPMMVTGSHGDAMQTVATLLLSTITIVLAPLIGDAALITATMTMGFETELIQAAVGCFTNFVGVRTTRDGLATLATVTVLVEGAVFQDVTALPNANAAVELNVMI